MRSYRTRSILSLLALAAASMFAAICWCSAQVVTTPSTRPVDPIARDLGQLDADIATVRAADAATIGALQKQLAGQSAATASAPKRGWLLANDETNAYYGVNRWADLAHGLPGWTPQSGNPAFQYSAHGYPTGAHCNAVATLYNHGVPSQTCQVTWTGNATLHISGAGTWTETGPNAATLAIVAEQPTFLLCDSSDPANPLDNLHIWQAGYGPTGPMYESRYLALWKTFAGARVMPSLKPNNNTAETDWNTRVTPDLCDWTTRGVPHECEIELAKEAGLKRLWITIPPNATADYLAQCAKLYHDTLPAGVELTAEYGNEDWNWGFKARQDIDAYTKANPSQFNGIPGTLATGDPNILDARCAAERARLVALAFRTAFADRPGDLCCVFGGQAQDPAWIDNGLSWLVAKYGGHPFDAIAVAAYFGFWENNGYFTHPSAGGNYTLDDCFAGTFAYLADATQKGCGLTWQLQQFAALGQRYHAKLRIYEAGEDDLDNPNGLSKASQTDYRMAACEAMNFALCHQYGIDCFCEFALIGTPWGPGDANANPNDDGFWSLLRTYGDMTPRWQACVTESLRSN